MSGDIHALFERLAARDPLAWPEFLQQYAALLLQVAREAERDPDHASDAFLFICEHLAAASGRRLRQWKPTPGGATFETWLRVVAWNLARDARRRRLGRFRPFAAIRRLSLLQQRLYRLRHEEGLTSDQAFGVIQPEFPGLSPAAVRVAEAEVDRVLGSREHFVLSTRRPVVEPIDASAEYGSTHADVPASGADPETAAIQRDEYEQLREALDRLSPRDRLLLQLRFEQGVTLARVAAMWGLKDPFAAARQIDRVLRALRASIGANRSGGSV